MLVVFILLILAGSASPALAAPQVYSLDSPHARVEFDADSTLHSFHGVSQQVVAEDISFDPETAVFAYPRRVTIPVAGLDTANARRDQNMKKMFELPVFSDILWNVISGDCKPSGQHSWACRQKGELTIHGITREAFLDLSVSEDETKKLSADGDLIVFLHDFNLKPPSVLGVIKVGDRVAVHLKTQWIPK